MITLKESLLDDEEDLLDGMDTVNDLKVKMAKQLVDDFNHRIGVFRKAPHKDVLGNEVKEGDILMYDYYQLNLGFIYKFSTDMALVKRTKRSNAVPIQSVLAIKANAILNRDWLNNGTEAERFKILEKTKKCKYIDSDMFDTQIQKGDFILCASKKPRPDIRLGYVLDIDTRYAGPIVTYTGSRDNTAYFFGYNAIRLNPDEIEQIKKLI